MRFPFRVTDRKALKYLIIPIVKSRRAWNWWKNKKDVNGTKFTGWNVPIGKRGQPFQTNRSFRKSSGWAVEICLFHLLTVWNHRNFHVNGKQPWNHNILPSAILFYKWNDVTTKVDILKIKNIISGKFIHSLCLNFKIGNTKK